MHRSGQRTREAAGRHHQQQRGDVGGIPSRSHSQQCYVERRMPAARLGGPDLKSHGCRFLFEYGADTPLQMASLETEHGIVIYILQLKITSMPDVPRNQEYTESQWHRQWATFREPNDPEDGRPRGEIGDQTQRLQNPLITEYTLTL